jgi:hypothetical protein
VGVEDNFFELGGHSLVATQIISQARRVFRVEIPISALFEKPTVRRLAEVIGNQARISPAEAERFVIARADEQNEPSLLAQLEGVSEEELDALIAQLSAEEHAADDAGDNPGNEGVLNGNLQRNGTSGR